MISDGFFQAFSPVCRKTTVVEQLGCKNVIPRVYCIGSGLRGKNKLQLTDCASADYYYLCNSKKQKHVQNAFWWELCSASWSNIPQRPSKKTADFYNPRPIFFSRPIFFTSCSVLSVNGAATLNFFLVLPKQFLYVILCGWVWRDLKKKVVWPKIYIRDLRFSMIPETPPGLLLELSFCFFCFLGCLIFWFLFWVSKTTKEFLWCCVQV